MANRKITYAENQSDTDFLNSIRTVSTNSAQPSAVRHEVARTVKTDTKPEEGDKSSKKVGCNIVVADTLLHQWKTFAAEHDTTVTNSIKRAMARYIKDVNNGVIEP